MWYSDFDFYGQYVGFDHPTFVNGKRSVAYPSVSLPLHTPYAYVTPKLGVTVTNYSIAPNTAGYTNETRTLPVFSTDTGMVFERPTTFGGAPFLQTLEPRLYYVYIPYQDQSSIPVFDSGQKDINFTTIYSENQFSGWDRINDANQLTFGATSRFLGADNGAEFVRVGLAQRYYFSTQRVTLPGVAPRTSNSSDLLAAISGNIAQHWTANAGLQYNTDSSQTQKFNIGDPLPAETGQRAQRKLPRKHQYPAAANRLLGPVAGVRGLGRPRALELLAAGKPLARGPDWRGIRCQLLGVARGRPPLRRHHAAGVHHFLPAARIERHVAYRL